MTKSKKFTKLQYKYAFDILMEIMSVDAVYLTPKFLKHVDEVACYLGEKARTKRK